VIKYYFLQTPTTFCCASQELLRHRLCCASHELLRHRRFYANTTAILRGVLANLRSTLSSGTVTRDVVGSPWADVKCPSVNITPTRSDAGASQQGNTIQCRYTSSTNSTIIDSEHQENKVQYSGGASSTLISKQARISRERERERERD